MIGRLKVPLWLESTAAIVLALIVSTVVTVTVFQLEDQQRTAQYHIDNLFERVPDVVSAIERAPPELRPDLLQTFSRATRAQ